MMLSAVQSVPINRTKLENREIEAMAEEIREANRKKVALAAASLPCAAALRQISQPEAAPSNEILSADQASQQGQFGWTDCEGQYIPYLIRQADKYVAQRIIEDKITVGFKQFFTNEVYSCCRLEGAKMTQTEAQLLNEINIRHSDMSFGKALFVADDNMVKLQDVIEMVEFLRYCYRIVIQKDTRVNKRCGFINITPTSYIPYVWLQGKKYVPLFFFDGQCHYLEEKALDLSDWDLAYLKLLCKLQGVRKQFFDTDTIRVAELDYAKEFLAPNTVFNEIWPSYTDRINVLVLKPARTNRNSKSYNATVKPATSRRDKIL